MATGLNRMPHSAQRLILTFSQVSTFYATATLATTAVPGPAPLFGAAAAFGMSRRLRRRIKTSL